MPGVYWPAASWDSFAVTIVTLGGQLEVCQAAWGSVPVAKGLLRTVPRGTSVKFGLLSD